MPFCPPKPFSPGCEDTSSVVSGVLTRLFSIFSSWSHVLCPSDRSNATSHKLVLGEALRPQYKLTEALAAENQALAIMREWFPPDHPTIGVIVNALARTQAMADGDLHRADEEEECLRNLEKIQAAIMAYRKDHQKMPDCLGDLVPAYLSDTNCLICPVEARTKEKPDLSGMKDPKIMSSYLYEFSAMTNIFPDPYGLAAPGDTMQAWKEKQLIRYGAIVPLVTCVLHQERIHVTFGGERMKSGDGRWEDEAEKKLGAGVKAAPTSRLTRQGCQPQPNRFCLIA
jgi:hypothetical protein